MNDFKLDSRYRSGFPQYFPRRKWMCVSGVFLILTLLSVLSFSLNNYLFIPSPRISKDEVLSEGYQKVLATWYNFSNSNKWYNRKNVSQRNKDLVREVKENWIIEKHELNYSLQSPEVKDPSMGQAEVIRQIFNYSRNGFFIECGAYDGETRSNTLNLERFYGWTGLLIEADPLNFAKMLMKKRKAYLSPSCLSIKPYPQIGSFLMANNIGRLHEPPNSTDVKLKNNADVAHVGKHVEVQCFPLATYIFAFNRTIDYLSLDIEGNEIDVLETIPFDSVDIKTLSVEYIHNERSRDYMIDLMKKNGYYVHSYVEHEDNLANDIIFVKEEFMPLKTNNLDIN
ncbi:uncharacterized protein LOC117171264 [Belonocnema kinseyi]|uniref:uncharacterized protein LOC117171264 n=1 Tax=Belonocnema kinseyi TaxID=2817044 RepID=UPI00143DBBE0|nr:uncharacterized protein LOC117171264 [Belonocnema kinseyi]